MQVIRHIHNARETATVTSTTGSRRFSHSVHVTLVHHLKERIAASMQVTVVQYVECFLQGGILIDKRMWCGSTLWGRGGGQENVPLEGGGRGEEISPLDETLINVPLPRVHYHFYSFRNVLVLHTFDNESNLDQFVREAAVMNQTTGGKNFIQFIGPGPMTIIGRHVYLQLFAIDPRVSHSMPGIAFYSLTAVQSLHYYSVACI